MTKTLIEFMYENDTSIHLFTTENISLDISNIDYTIIMNIIIQNIISYFDRYVILCIINICCLIYFNYKIKILRDTEDYKIEILRDTEEHIHKLKNTIDLYKNKISNIKNIFSKRNLKYNGMTIEKLIDEANNRSIPYLRNCNKYIISDMLRLIDKLDKLELELEVEID